MIADKFQPGNFRRYLVHRLMNTGWAYVNLNRPDLEDLSKRLGVQLDVLLDAHARAADERRKRGLRVSTGQLTTQNRVHYPQLKVVFCKPVWDAWLEECERRGVQSSTLLRSLVHAYLLGGWEPEVLVAKGWWWQGKLVRAEWTALEHNSPLRERTLVTTGAKLAFGLRCTCANVHYVVMLRGLVLHLLAGKLPELRMVDARTMWDDPEKYNAPKR